MRIYFEFQIAELLIYFSVFQFSFNLYFLIPADTFNQIILLLPLE